ASCSLIAPAIVAGDPRQQFLIPRLVRTETGDELRGPRAGDGHHRPASAIDEHAAVLGDAVGEWIVLEAHGRPTMTPDIALVTGHGALPCMERFRESAPSSAGHQTRAGTALQARTTFSPSGSMSRVALRVSTTSGAPSTTAR